MLYSRFILGKMQECKGHYTKYLMLHLYCHEIYRINDRMHDICLMFRYFSIHQHPRILCSIDEIMKGKDSAPSKSSLFRNDLTI